MALATNYYVRPTNGTDAPGGGTSHAAAYKTIQYALDDIGSTHGRDANNGDAINICGAAGEGPAILAAQLTLATYGTPAVGAPLVMRGYTATYADGGRGAITNGLGAVMWNPAPTYVVYIDLDISITEDGNYSGVNGGAHNQLWRCSVLAPGARAILLTDGAVVAGCYCTSGLGTGGTISTIHLGSNGLAYGNYVAGATTCNGLYGTWNTSFIGNIVKLPASGVAGHGISMYQGSIASGNIVYCTNAGVSVGIMSDYQCSITNNIICGYSGVGGSGTAFNRQEGMARGHNAFWNCSTPNAGEFQLEMGNDVLLAADPFTDAANGDFSLTAAAQAALAGKGWPGQYLGAHANTVPHLNIGPIQMAAASYPAVGDVQTGVVYGGGTGTLNLPAEADVRSGTGYGEDGTEFTGTLSVTGGGGVSRVIGG